MPKDPILEYLEVVFATQIQTLRKIEQALKQPVPEQDRSRLIAEKEAIEKEIMAFFMGCLAQTYRS